jgi:hypothetical protein
MAERSDQPQNPSSTSEQPEVYEVRQDKDGALRLSRKGFLYFSAALGGSLLLRGFCPRFGGRLASSGEVQARMAAFPRVYIHTAPSIASNIAETLRQNDYVRLISDHPELGWVEVSTRNGQRLPSSTATHTQPHLTFSAQLRGGDHKQNYALAHAPTLACGEAIQNGDFEVGGSAWIEESTGTIIRNDWPDPYQGSWVAWFGGLDAVERLTQLFHVPADVEDAQTLTFYVKVITEETSTQVSDTLDLRFLNASGNPITSDIKIANNTTPTDWFRVAVDLTGITTVADTDIQVQFECTVNSSYSTSFVVDLVSLNLVCGSVTPQFYLFLPVVSTEPTATPTSTPTATPRPSATPCPSYDPCPSYCSSDCTSDCRTDYCSSDCSLDCIYDCTFDCIYDCGADWCYYN